ncbi:MAG: DUF2029 domain-containing protein, partial [Phycisphaerae bacterium]|nr:DUF2029 domain-containing protein [Phycisphaerae bacterium]
MRSSDERASHVSRQAHPWLVWALGLWVVFAAAVVIKTLVSPEQRTVFPKCAARAGSWWQGKPLYAQHEGLGRFPYSPTFAIALTPFWWLGNRFGAALWTLMMIGVYVGGLRRLARDVLPGDWPPQREAVLLLLAMLGAIRGFWNAQTNALIIGLLMLAASAIVRRRWWTATALLAVPFYLKVWPVAISMLCVVLWPRKLAGRFAVAMAIGAAIPFLTQMPAVVIEQYRGWWSYLSVMSMDLVRSYRDVWTVSRLLGASWNPTVYRVLQAATGLAVLGWCLWQQRRAWSTQWLLTWTLSLGAAWAMLFGPSIEYNTVVVLAPFGAWAVLLSLEQRQGRVLAGAAFVTATILAAGAIERLWVDAVPAAVATLAVGSLLFAAWVILAA